MRPAPLVRLYAILIQFSCFVFLTGPPAAAGGTARRAAKLAGLAVRTPMLGGFAVSPVRHEELSGKRVDADEGHLILLAAVRDIRQAVAKRRARRIRVFEDGACQERFQGRHITKKLQFGCIGRDSRL